MPQSSASGKTYIADLIKRINPQRVFDVGVDHWEAPVTMPSWDEDTISWLEVIG